MTTAQPQPKPLRVNVSRHVSAFFSYLVWKSRLNLKVRIFEKNSTSTKTFQQNLLSLSCKKSNQVNLKATSIAYFKYHIWNCGGLNNW